METLITNTTNFVNELVKDVLLPIVVDYINQHDQPQSITTDELEQVLQLNTKFIKRNSVPIETDYNKKCIWEYKRGKSKGDLCGKPTVRGKNYCSTCIKRSVFTPKQVSQDVTKTQIIFDDIPKSAENDSQNLDLEIYDEDNNLFKNQCTNFVFKRDGDEFKLIGKADNTKDLIHKLTQEDIIKANQLNYPIDEDFLEEN